MKTNTSSIINMGIAFFIAVCISGMLTVKMPSWFNLVAMLVVGEAIVATMLWDSKIVSIKAITQFFAGTCTALLLIACAFPFVKDFLG